MITKLQAEQARLRYQFRIGWLVFTLLILAAVAFVSLEHIRLKIRGEFQQHANHLVFKLDELVEDVLEIGHKLPYYDTRSGHCPPQLTEKLNNMVFNNLYVSGAMVSDESNHTLCSSAGLNLPPPAPDQQSPVLLGPIHPAHGNNDVFLLQQRLGQYRVGMYLIRPVLEDFIRKHSVGMDFVGLYNRNNNSVIVQTGNLAAFDNHILRADNRDSNNDFDVTLPLQNLDNISLLASSHPVDRLQQMGRYLALVMLPFLLLSWLFYRYCIQLIQHRFSLEFALMRALKKEQFYPVYQAIYDEEQQRFCGAEVLMRWHTDDDETLYPDQFVSEAEASGLIVPMTLQLIEKALHECHALLTHNAAFYLSFNLSPAHFRDAQFFTGFHELCTRYAIPPRQLMLEMTERELFNKDDADVAQRMHDLRKRGYLLTLDDFGTGHSNLQYLQQFQFNYLKIDKLFVHSIGTGAITETLNQSIITMAHSLHLHVIAEGVETQIQRDYLHKARVRYIQGWFYSEAVTIQRLTHLMEQSGSVT